MADQGRHQSWVGLAKLGAAYAGLNVFLIVLAALTNPQVGVNVMIIFSMPLPLMVLIVLMGHQFFAARRFAWRAVIVFLMGVGAIAWLNFHMFVLAMANV